VVVRLDAGDGPAASVEAAAAPAALPAPGARVLVAADPRAVPVFPTA
jgi:hypothetical protein